MKIFLFCIRIYFLILAGQALGCKKSLVRTINFRTEPEIAGLFGFLVFSLGGLGLGWSGFVPGAFGHVMEHLRLFPVLFFAGLEEHREGGNGGEGKRLFHGQNFGVQHSCFSLKPQVPGFCN